MTFLEAALEFAAKRWPVFPVRARGKTPLTRNGLKDASTDQKIIREWWTKWPSANIGVPTQNFVVADIDGANGEASLRALEAEFGPLPSTLQSSTGKGRHFWFAANGTAIRNSAGKLGDGIDIRGIGGYAVVPPSVHESGKRYQWISDDTLPVPLPAWIAAKLMEPTSRANGSGNDQNHKIPIGQRNLTLTSLAGAMRRRGVSEAAILAALREHNQQCCDPPLADHEVQTIAASVSRYPAGTSTESARVPKATVSVGEDRLTEAGAAERFARLHGDDVRYDHRSGHWLLYEHHRWRRDADAAITRLALEFARRWQHDAVEIPDREKREAAFKAALRLERRDALSNMLALAHDLKPIADAGDGWDMDPHLLGVPNGVVDLRTGDLRNGRREDKISLAAGVAYDPEAPSPLWEDALRAILVESELIDFFQAGIGYSATGDTALDRWFLGFGSGRNGKGTLAHPIRAALGEYALELPASVFDSKTERAPYELARLPGRRLVTSSESGDTIRLNHDRIKQLSGGDPMSAANKYQRAFEFQPKCKLWLFCNKKPRVTDDTAAFWSRVLLLPFVISFAGREDHTLRPKLTQEPFHQAAILAWVVRGAVRYFAKQGLSRPPEAVIEATRQYREDQDVLGPFLDQACEFDAEAETGASDLYDHYLKWAERQHLTTKERMTSTMFGRIVGGRFKSRKDRVRGVRLYAGIAIKGLF